MNYWFPFILTAITFIMISSCEKKSTDDKGSLLGSWVSTDLADTIEFSSYHDLFKLIYGVRDHYDYSLSKDSILIQYSGMLLPFAYIGPPKDHFYQLNGEKLTIDFRPYCFGFLSQTIIFIRR